MKPLHLFGDLTFSAVFYQLEAMASVVVTLYNATLKLYVFQNKSIWLSHWSYVLCENYSICISKMRMWTKILYKCDSQGMKNVYTYLLVSRGQTLFSCRGVIAFSISAPCEKDLVLFTGLTGTGTTIVVGSVN